MKECEFCGVEKSLSEFKMRKRPPIQPYRFCKTCEPVAYGRKNVDFQKEMNLLRDKAKSMRAFSPTQDVEIYRRVLGGETRRAIALEFKVCETAVGKAYKRGRSLTNPKG